MLTLEGVRASYGAVEVLHGVSLRVEPGAIVAIIGANGAGKSTLLKTISSLLPCRAGRVLFDGHDVTNAPAEAIVSLGITQVPEGRRIFGAFSVEENLRMGTYACYRRLSPRDRAERLRFVFDLFPVLRERLDQPGSTLSGGEQQMLAIARALMAGPRLLLMDEPSLGLAPRTADTIFDALATLNQRGITLVLVEQNALRALNLAQRGYLMDVGNIVLQAASGDLLRDPKVKEIYLGELTPDAR